MKKIKITVLRKTFIEDLVDEYGVNGFTPCKAFQEGQVFYTHFGKPEGFCGEAWKAIYQYAYALAHGADTEPFYGEGVWMKKPGVTICSCNDGLRPVIFKLEVVE